MPMSYQQLLAWISISDLEESRAAEVLQLVEPALDELAEDDPRYDPLVDIEDELLEGRVPVELLRALLGAEGASPGDLDDVERLEREYRGAAAAYQPEQWRSKFYLELERHLSESDDEALLDCVDGLRDRITSVWNRYCQDYASLSTRSAETEVGHRLMKDGYDRWMKALDLVESEEADEEEILAVAEAAVRLLVAVGQLDRDVKMQARSAGGGPYARG